MTRVRQWTLKVGFSVLDQGLTSAASFGLNVVLARVLSATAYGAFSFCFVIFLVLSSAHSALIIEPMSVLGPSRHNDNLVRYLRRLVWVHFILMVGLAMVSAAIAWYFRNQILGPVLLAMSISSPLILLFWMARRAHYLETRPDLAVLTSGLHLACLAIITFVLWRLHKLTATTGFLALAGAGALAGLFSMRRLGIGLFPSVREARESKPIAREHWNFGVWLLPSALFFPLLSQIQIVLSAKMLNLESAGILRALQNPILPVIQVVSALAVLAIPMLARDFGAGDKATMYRRGVMYTGVMTLVAVAYEIAVLLTGNLWDKLLYAGKYSAYDWLMPVLGIVPIATAIATGCSVLLRAIHRPELTTVTHIVGGVFGFIASYFFILYYKVPGAIYGLVASHVMTALVSVVITIRAKAGTVAVEPIKEVAAL
jgi:O-antigen/teichoic acid export membrane protein